jgi:5-methyltetrahydropteroyltriglutamate--homocysteine methyltransferase
MAKSANLGFPRIGAFRELKKTIESFWKGEIQETELQAKAKEIRVTNWNKQKDAGIDIIPSNDFSFYDQVLDHTALFGAVPFRYKHDASQNVSTQTYFAMARGIQKEGLDVTAMEMTKWFDTNYHYIVPELYKGIKFKLSSTKIFDQYKEAKDLGIETRPVILGPVTYLKLGKVKEEGVKNLDFLAELLPVYHEIFAKLEALGCTEIQIDEPFLALDLTDEEKRAYTKTYNHQMASKTKLKINVTTYFDSLRDNLDVALNLPIHSLHIDLVRGKNQLDEVLAKFPAGKKLSIGVVDGRNIWKNNFAESAKLIEKAKAKVGSENLIIAGSCSLIHTPVDLANEKKLDAEIKNWFAYATQKLTEITVLTKFANEGEASVSKEFAENAKVQESRKTSAKIHDNAVKERTAKISNADLNRATSFKTRIAKQQDYLNLPPLPTTTIGSFPQTAEVRKARADFKAGVINEAQYEKFLEEKTAECIKIQEELNIDVPVHGEFERNDMVEYFGEQMKGYVFSENGWVQSYGSRCVKPPVIFGDVSRPEPMTVRWSKFAQSLTKRPVKGMLTGPVTMLQWSFVRDDQPRETTCKQLALAILDEVIDLQKAGIKIIQIDEPAIREGLPLRNADKKAYLQWAVDSFKISSSRNVEDTTQIHTHMCYSEFNDIISNVADMDADVISIETSRSDMELLDAFVNFKYPNQIGPGVYDIHSPRVPKAAEMEKLLDKALLVLEPSQVWVNPDCGLKTRGWAETKGALEEMVKATENVRKKLASSDKKVANA